MNGWRGPCLAGRKRAWGLVLIGWNEEIRSQMEDKESDEGRHKRQQLDSTHLEASILERPAVCNVSR